MSQISDQRKQIESQFMKDCWELRKQIATPEERQDYWKEVMNSMVALSKKYGEDELFNNILLAYLNDIEEHSPINSRVRREGSASLALFNYFRKKRNLPPVEVKT